MKFHQETAASVIPEVHLHLHFQCGNQDGIPTTLQRPCDVCQDWKDVDQRTLLCPTHADTALDGNPQLLR